MKKTLAVFLIIAMFVIALAGCSSQESLVSKIDFEETYPEAPGQLDVVYQDINAITQDATVIVYVSIEGQSVEMLDGFPQTHTEVYVQEVYKGNVDIGDTLEVIEEGGQEGKVMGGLPQLSDSYKYILFLTEYNENYYICGAFQGRFVEREGYMFQQATEDAKMQTYSPVSVEDFVSSLAGLTVEGDKVK